MFQLAERDPHPIFVNDQINPVDVTVARITAGRVTLEIVQLADNFSWEIGGDLRGFFFDSFD